MTIQLCTIVFGVASLAAARHCYAGADASETRAPVRVVADGGHTYRFQEAAGAEEPVKLQRRARADATQVDLFTVPGLSAPTFRDNAMPFDIVDGDLLYVTMATRDVKHRGVLAVLARVSPFQLSRYDGLQPRSAIRFCQPSEAVAGLGRLEHKARMTLLEGTQQFWFDVVQESPRKYLVFSQIHGTLEIERYDLASENIAERTHGTIAELRGDLVGPFHAFRWNNGTYILEANGAVSRFEANALRSVGEIKDLRGTNLSAKHVIFHDRASGSVYILKRDGDRLLPLEFTPLTSDEPNPFTAQLDESLEKAVLATDGVATVEQK